MKTRILFEKTNVKIECEPFWKLMWWVRCIRFWFKPQTFTITHNDEPVERLLIFVLGKPTFIGPEE
ncbi:hypothetical protein [Desemzia sp. FAM 23991]|uniref:hypothetical protein n=1 Tax=unclassified Desemzia TaxID=2685243 RepID=UPI003885631B